MTSLWYLSIAVVGVLAGGVAAVAGFGIGSLLTPLLGLRLGMRLAVGAVSLPHVLGTGLRLWRLRGSIDYRVLWSFGVMSALGGLAGALLHGVLLGPALTVILGVLLVFAGIAGLTGLTESLRLHGWTAWLAGAVSGFLGGLVGNQGGIRSAALLGFDVPKQAFVATATAIALFVDAARVPVYLAQQGEELLRVWPEILAASAGVLIGTLLGERVLRRIPDRLFRRIVAGIILALGVALLVGTGYGAFHIRAPGETRLIPHPSSLIPHPSSLIPHPSSPDELGQYNSNRVSPG